jgi:TRAP-type uncharacterized transport system substrate-binding protein
MERWGRIVFSILAVAVSLIAVVWLVLWYFIPAPPSTITIASGLPGGSFEHIAVHYRDRMVQRHVSVNVRLTNGSLDSARLVTDPNSGVDAAILLGSALSGVKTSELVSLGRITYSPVWFFHRGQEPIEHLSQLKGKRITVAPVSGLVVREVLASYGVTPQNATFSTLAIQEAAKALTSGATDVIGFSQEVNGPSAQSLLRDPTVRVINVAQAAALTQLFPSLNHLVLSQGVIDLEKNIPPNDVNLIALTNAVVARADLHPEMIYLLAQTMKEEHGRGGIFHRTGDFPTNTDPELPVAAEALDYYRNGPPFFQRYLPFWMINDVKRLIALLLAVFAVVIPLFSYTPRLYHWFLRIYLTKLYRRLRGIETELDNQLTVAQVEALQKNLENINRAARFLPMRHSDLFIDVMTHIRLMRMELATRLAAVRG